MKKKLRIGYFADGKWGHNALTQLLTDKEISISFVCVRYDTQDPVLQKIAADNHIDCLAHPNINSQEFIKKIRNYDCDLLVSMSFNQIFKQEIINLTPHGIINCHAGKLPFYRGRNILNWALINDEKEFGITVHYVDEGIDTGNIILQKSYEITDEDNYSTLLEVAHTECAAVLYKAISLFKLGKPNSIKQSTIHPVGFYCSQRKVGDEILNWNQTSREAFNFIRSISKPGPIARAFINGQEMKINKAIFIPDAPNYKGIVGAILDKKENEFLVKTKDSFIKIVDYEFTGKFRVGDRFE